MTVGSERDGVDAAADPALAEIDLTDASVWEQGAPHQWLDLLRREDPVHWHEESDGPGFWALTRHEDVRQVSVNAGRLLEPRRWSDPGGSRRGGPRAGPDDHHRDGPSRTPPVPQHRGQGVHAQGHRHDAGWPAGRDPPSRADLRDRDRCEFVTDVAARIPMWSISELMGVPDADRYRLYELSHALIDDQDPEVAPTPEKRIESLAEIFEYATAMAARERAAPRDNLTGALLAAEVDGRALDRPGVHALLHVPHRGRQRDHPDGQLTGDPGPPRAPRSAPPAGSGPEPDPRGRRGDPALGAADPPLPANGHRSTRSWVAPPSPMATRSSCGTPDRTGTHPSSTILTPSTSSGRRTPICPSGSVSTSASGPISPVCRCRSCSTSCWRRITDIELEAPPRRLHSNLINGIKELRIGYRVR